MKKQSLLFILILAILMAACNGNTEEEEPTPVETDPTPTVDEEDPSSDDGYPVETPDTNAGGYPVEGVEETEAWLILPAGQQCQETLAYPTADSAVADLEAAGVELLAVEETELTVCEACTCPTSAHYRVLVSGDDISTAISIGWQREP